MRHTSSNRSGRFVLTIRGGNRTIPRPIPPTLPVRDVDRAGGTRHAPCSWNSRNAAGRGRGDHGGRIPPEREVYFVNRGFVVTPIVDRQALAVGEAVDGPASLEESGRMSLLPPLTTAEIPEDGNLPVDL